MAHQSQKFIEDFFSNERITQEVRSMVSGLRPKHISSNEITELQCFLDLVVRWKFDELTTNDCYRLMKGYEHSFVISGIDIHGDCVKHKWIKEFEVILSFDKIPELFVLFKKDTTCYTIKRSCSTISIQYDRSLVYSTNKWKSDLGEENIRELYNMLKKMKRVCFTDKSKSEILDSEDNSIIYVDTVDSTTNDLSLENIKKDTDDDGILPTEVYVMVSNGFPVLRIILGELTYLKQNVVTYVLSDIEFNSGDTDIIVYNSDSAKFTYISSNIGFSKKIGTNTQETIYHTSREFKQVKKLHEPVQIQIESKSKTKGKRGREKNLERRMYEEFNETNTPFTSFSQKQKLSLKKIVIDIVKEIPDCEDRLNKYKVNDDATQGIFLKRKWDQIFDEKKFLSPKTEHRGREFGPYMECWMRAYPSAREDYKTMTVSVKNKTRANITEFIKSNRDWKNLNLTELKKHMDKILNISTIKKRKINPKKMDVFVYNNQTRDAAKWYLGIVEEPLEEYNVVEFIDSKRNIIKAKSKEDKQLVHISFLKFPSSSDLVQDSDGKYDLLSDPDGEVYVTGFTNTHSV